MMSETKISNLQIKNNGKIPLKVISSLYCYKLLRFKFIVDSLLRFTLYMILTSDLTANCYSLQIISLSEDNAIFGVVVISVISVIGFGYFLYNWVSKKDELIPATSENSKKDELIPATSENSKLDYSDSSTWNSTSTVEPMKRTIFDVVSDMQPPQLVFHDVPRRTTPLDVKSQRLVNTFRSVFDDLPATPDSTSTVTPEGSEQFIATLRDFMKDHPSTEPLENLSTEPLENPDEDLPPSKFPVANYIKELFNTLLDYLWP
jgi:hypothetical protein